jgi:crossover junction endodeoxyribonuclease RusA
VTWRIELPTCQAPLSANARVHWATRAARARELREQVALLLRQAGVPPLGRAELLVVLCPPDGRKRDGDNYIATVLKPIKDGLVDARVVPDDTDEHVRWSLVLAPPTGDPEGRWRYIVEVQPCGS